MEDAVKLTEKLGDKISIYKVGLESFLSTDGKLVDYLHEKGKKVFLDLKFHDITNTVKMACANAIKKKMFMFNIHCSNGSKTMKEVSDLVKESGSESLLIAQEHFRLRQVRTDSEAALLLYRLVSEVFEGNQQQGQCCGKGIGEKHPQRKTLAIEELAESFGLFQYFHPRQRSPDRALGESLPIEGLSK